MAWSPARVGWLLVALPLFGWGCSREEEYPKNTFYGQKIAPILGESCSRSPGTQSGCHVLATDGSNALGNLSIESYELLNARRDLLIDYGPYGMSGLLLKVVHDTGLSLTSWDSTEPTLITTQISHAGGQLIDSGSSGFTALERWIRNGATENNAGQNEVVVPREGCAEALGTDPLFDPTVDPATADYAQFQSQVNAVLGSRCAAGNCHGSPANSLYLTCGQGPEQTRWNYFAAGDYVSASPGASEILQRTLDPAVGGTFHEGGTIFGSVNDSGYRAILDWATVKGGPTHIPSAPGFSFFATRVQPMLVKRGCMMLGCHSASMFHDYRLRGGAGGHFGLPATRRNYELTLDQVALESPDPNASRLLRKNLASDGPGILHRGGSLFAGSTPEACDLAEAETGPLDDQPPYCVIVAWIARERADRMAGRAPLSGIVYVRRPARPGPDTPQDWEPFSPGAEVVRVEVTVGDDGALGLGAEESLSAVCGLDPASSEARRPAVSWDGAQIAFSARTGAGEPYRVYLVGDGGCGVEPAIDAPPVDQAGNALPDNGELLHNFDPAFAPDGSIVFVSTRGNIDNTAAFSYQGPQRTPADPSKLNTNLYVRENDGRIRQLTFLLNQELLPSFMRDGRVILSTEKRAPEFYQLAGRRINLDGGDYHPLFGQRSSIGYDQFSDVVELADKNLAVILSQRGAVHGAGALGIVNRSIGIDLVSQDPADFPVSPGAIGAVNPKFYQHSQRLIDPAATGRLDGTQGAYRSPSPLPDGRLLASHAASATNLAAFDGGFDIVVVDPFSGSVTPLVTGAEDELWPVAVYARPPGSVFRSRLDEVNGATSVTGDSSGTAEVTYLDLPLLTSLLFQNTRDGRAFVPEGGSVEFWQSLPPEPGVTGFTGPFATRDQYGDLYVRRSLLGRVRPLSDGSAKVRLPGGMPFMVAAEVKLSSDAAPQLHFQREEQQVYPGERLRQSFKRDLFGNLCGGCHGSVSGLEYRVAANPDILTQASSVEARGARAEDLSSGSGTPEGPSFP